MKILVTGGHGTFGAALRAHYPDAVYLGKDVMDVGDREQVWRTLSKVRPEVIVHGGAITDHQCADAAALIRTNVLGTKHLADGAKALGATLVYLSTHYVYPGVTGGYKESDPAQPIGAYAWSKYAGERFCEPVRDLLIVRGSWYTPAKVRGWAYHLTDAYTNREPVADAARTVATLMHVKARGLVNIGGTRRTFAEIARDEGVPVQPITRAEFDALHRAPYPFPADSSVDTSRCRGYLSLMTTTVTA